MSDLSKLAQRKLRGGIPASALSPDDQASAGVKASKLRTLRSQVARGEEVELPGYGRVWLQLLSHDLVLEVEAATQRKLTAMGIEFKPSNAFPYDMERWARTLAYAVRDLEDPTHATPFGPVEEWLNEDDDLIFSASLVYKDVIARLDPVRAMLTEDERDDIAEAVKKNNKTRLLLHGVATLASFLLSGDVLLASSPIPASKSGDSLPESSEE